MLHDELSVYIKSLQQLIFINTKELNRCIEEVKSFIETFNKNLYMYELPDNIKASGFRYYNWDMINGLIENNSEVIDKKTCDILNALEAVGNDNYPAGFYIFSYSDISITTKYNNSGRIPYFFHLLNNYKQKLQEKLKWIIFVGDISIIPEEIKSLFILIDFELPDTNAIRNHVLELFKTEKIDYKKSNIDIDKIVENCKGMTLDEVENTVRISLVRNDYKFVNLKDIFKEKEKIIKKSNLLEYVDTNFDLTSVGGLDNLKEEVYKVSKIYSNIENALNFGLKLPKGFLLIGIAGTGKTLASKAIAKELKLPLYRAEIGAIFGGIVGETEKNTRELFKLIKAVSPAVIQIDEIEKAFSGSGHSGVSDGGVTDRLLGSFLTYMQERDYPCFFVATCNDIKSLPAPFVRKGRWDEIFFIDLPNLDERKEIIKIKIKETGRDWNKFDVDKLAVLSENLTGAEIEIAIQTSLKECFFKGIDLDQKVIENTFKNTKGIAQLKESEILELRNWVKDKAKFANKQVEQIKTKKNIFK